MGVRTIGGVAVLALVAGSVGYSLRGVVDEPASPAEPMPAPHAIDVEPEPRRVRTRRPPDAPEARQTHDADAPQRTTTWRPPTPARIEGLDMSRAEARARIAELLESARADADTDRVRILLQVAYESRTAAGRRLVLDAMLSDDVGFDVNDRDGFFLQLLGDEPAADVGAAALARLRFELDRGENGPGSVGGYVQLVGIAGGTEGRAFLDELRVSRHSSLRSLAAFGLAATGDPTVIVELAREHDFGRNLLEPFMEAAEDRALPALRIAVLDPDVRLRTRSEIAQLLVRDGTAEDFLLMDRVWDAGYPNAAISAYGNMNGPPADAAALQRARNRVYAAIDDEEFDEGARRNGFYLMEYEELFQTERAATLLTSFLARNDQEYWEHAARAALRETQKRLRRNEVAERR